MSEHMLGSKFIAYELYLKKGNDKFICGHCKEPINGKVYKRSLMKSFGVLTFLDYICGHDYEEAQKRIKELTNIRKL